MHVSTSHQEIQHDIIMWLIQWDGVLVKGRMQDVNGAMEQLR